jgi:hypothetical protein
VTEDEHHRFYANAIKIITGTITSVVLRIMKDLTSFTPINKLFRENKTAF